MNAPFPVAWFLAALHLLALGIGLGAVWARARALRAPLDRDGLRRVFAADAWWGVAALVWIATGLLRALGGFEKGTIYYLHNNYFLLKMGLLILVLVLEVWPMTALIRWRIAISRGAAVDTSRAGTFATISYAQTVLIVMMVLAATAMARGFGSA